MSKKPGMSKVEGAAIIGIAALIVFFSMWPVWLVLGGGWVVAHFAVKYW